MQGVTVTALDPFKIEDAEFKISLYFAVWNIFLSAGCVPDSVEKGYKSVET